ncbi:MAG: nucleotide-binding universal stress UspA family protein [Cellvibrionaceae bacterium]|jgi:nucleotide-binding universal stress UspA family protein
MFKKILIPLDGSMEAEQALGLVGKILPVKDIELILIEATGQPNPAYPLYGSGIDGHVQIIPEYRKENVDEYVGSITQTTREWVPNVRGYSMVGKPDEAIVEIAVKEDIDLIIMVTHGYTGLEWLLFGSVTEMVIRDAPCPVLAVRDGHLPKHILIALDGTPFSETILEPAFALAKLIKADITLGRIDVPADDINRREVEAIRKIDPGLADSLLYSANHQSDMYLDNLLKHYKKEAAELEIKIDYDVDYGTVGTRLPKLAERNGCDLIAMATHGRKRLDRFWNRSVTEDVMHRTKTAMFILHPNPVTIN